MKDIPMAVYFDLMLYIIMNVMQSDTISIATVAKFET